MIEEVKLFETAVPEEKYLEALQQSLNELPRGFWALLCLTHKFGNFDDDLEKTPLFSFPTDNIPKDKIMKVAKKIADVTWQLPSLKVKYAIITAPQAEMDQLVEICRAGGIKAPLLKTVLEKYLEQSQLAI